MRCSILRTLCLSLFVGAATPALADPIQFTFAGTLGIGSTLTRANGPTVDISFMPFIVTGLTDVVDPRANERYPDATNVFGPFLVSALIWNFWDLGDLTTYEPFVRYTESYAVTTAGRSLTSVGLRLWDPNQLDLLGFIVDIADVPAPPASTPPTPTAIGSFDVIATIAGTYPVYSTNHAGDQFMLGGIYARREWATQITNGEVRAVPEPASLALLLIGVGVLARVRRH